MRQQSSKNSHLKLKTLSSFMFASLLSACGGDQDLNLGLNLYDGMRVETIDQALSGDIWINQQPTENSMVRIIARNQESDSLRILHSRSPRLVSESRTLDEIYYKWEVEDFVLPDRYWKEVDGTDWQEGTDGSIAELFIEWRGGSDDPWQRVYVPRADTEECMEEYTENGGRSDFGLLDSVDIREEIENNCFSHREEMHLYTQGHRLGASNCEVPSDDLAQIHGHYTLNQMPSCAQEVVSDLMLMYISRDTIVDHYEINHDAPTTDGLPTEDSPGGAHAGFVGRLSEDDGREICSAQSSDPENSKIGDGICELGGFFGGHELYLKKMERFLMVYDYPWAPNGKIPTWDGTYIIPDSFQVQQTRDEEGNGVFGEGDEGCRSTGTSAIPCALWHNRLIGVDRSDGAEEGDRLSPDSAIEPIFSEDRTPFRATPDNICDEFGRSVFPDPAVGASQLAREIMPWHNRGHTLTGGTFATTDSPALPLFYTWHNTVNDIWLNFKACSNETEEPEVDETVLEETENEAEAEETEAIAALDLNADGSTTIDISSDIAQTVSVSEMPVGWTPRRVVFGFRSEDGMPMNGLRVEDSNGRVYSLTGSWYQVQQPFNSESVSLVFPEGQDNRTISVDWWYES